MKRTVSILTVAIAIAMLAPAALAGWSSGGNAEPDSVYDVSDFMWPDAPSAGEKRIYFNVFEAMAGAVNTNVAATGSQLDVYGSQQFVGYLGEWVDCNGDGYVGMAEGAVLEYRAELLTLPGAVNNCPAGSSGNHNTGSLVTELIPIARNGLNLNGDKRLIIDTEAMVWGDQGRPVPTNADDAPAEGASCAIRPVPDGTTRTTGRLLQHADCFVLTQSGGDLKLSRLYNQAVLAAGNPAGLALADDFTWDQEGHALNVALAGDDDSSNSAVTVQDCSAAPLVSLDPLPGTDFDGRGVRPPSPTTNADGNAPGTVNRTKEESVADNCDTRDDAGHDFYAFEGENFDVYAAFKSEADMNFNFTGMKRGGVPCGPATQTQFCGVSAAGRAMGADSVWTGGVSWTNTPSTVRTDLSPAPATFWTFYAFVGSAAKTGRALPSATVGTYGNLFCPSFGADSGVHHGWVCDPSQWYLKLDGTPQTEDPRFLKFARPGQTYQFRDTDCYDGTLVDGVPVGLSPASISDTTCDSAALS